MGEVFLDKTISLLSSDKQKARSDDLKHIFQQNKKSSKLQTLNDKACHKIFESLFRFVAAERSIYNRAQKSSKTPSASRLSTCASVLRMAVDLFLRNLRIKTVRAIVDHITETIPAPGEGLWEPLSLDYTKCLASLLRYRPHTEHLDEEDWENLISFCLASISPQENEESQLSIRSGYRSVPEDQDASDSRSTPQGLPSPPPHINAVVTKVMFDQSELVRSVLLGLVPVIRRLWATKLQLLKEELISTLMLSMVVLVDTARKDPSESLAHDIEALASTLHSEYVKRAEKEILQIDETTLYHNEACRSRPVYGPCLGTARSEHNWTVLWLIAELLKLSDGIHTRIKSESESVREGSNKRQRFSSEIQDVFRDSVSATGTRRICALQLIPFLESEVDIETKESFLKQLFLNVSDGNDAVSSWTMVALTSRTYYACILISGDIESCVQPSEYDFAVRLVGLLSSYGDNAVTLDFCQWAIRYLRLVLKAMGLNCTNEDTARSWVGSTNLDTDM
ncbi:PIK-related kinase FATC [Penicillium mononematosum]|uniref:PIK-related kinase FATC n=1 Tax=Penicillium mononematosum TaxID=268346 RepID=UPI002548853A|nr:PIK-related kinase FATC [Penicillium mononematosum]KAJ6184784.1 PIK-related kinase FATC [Penicillium mononematosum]